MDYKEKYEMALERARKNYETAQKLSDSSRLTIDCFMGTLTSIFPELKKSEDEKIRKDVYNYLYNERHNIRQLTPYTDELDRWLAWLEKQGEQKPMTEEFEHELAEICNQLLSEIDSEWMNNEILDCIGTSVWLNLCDETAKRYKDGLLKLAKQGEQKPAEWGEEDEKMMMFCCDYLDDNQINWLKSLKQRIGG